MMRNVAVTFVVMLAVAGCGTGDAGSAAAGKKSVPPVADPYPSVKEVSCQQLGDAYAGRYDLGTTPAKWADQLLADLLEPEAWVERPTKTAQAEFAAAVKRACRKSAQLARSARFVGEEVYNATPDTYRPTR
jgi:hypothetical protein